jgi:hypothetical protein
VQESFVDYHEDLLFTDLDAFNQQLANWLVFYNAERPHHTLGQQPPLRFLLEHQPECQRWWTHTRERVRALRREKRKAQVRAFVEHPFRIVKCVFGYRKVRFKGLLKNTAQVLTLFALANLYMARKLLMPSAGKLRPQFG